MTTDAPSLSVIVGGQNSPATVRDCLAALTRQAAAASAEIIFADASTDGTTEIVASEFPQVKLLRGAPGSLVPHLWRLGFDIARGPIVAFTIAQCIPAGDWLAKILAAHYEGVAGVGGPIEGPASTRGLDWALYFARYSAYLPPGTRGPIDGIAGDNAAYKRIALDLCRREMAGGFWETLAHHRLRAEGETLVFIPEMRVRLGTVGGRGERRMGEHVGSLLRAMAGVRFRHGRHYGTTRPGNTLPKRLAHLAASPLIVPALLARIAERVRRHRPDWTPHLLRALPALVVLLSAWTLGEVSGYAWPQPEVTPRLAE